MSEKASQLGAASAHEPLALERTDSGNMADNEDGGADDSPRTPPSNRETTVEAFGQTLKTSGPLNLKLPSDLMKGGTHDGGVGRVQVQWAGGGGPWGAAECQPEAAAAELGRFLTELRDGKPSHER